MKTKHIVSLMVLAGLAIGCVSCSSLVGCVTSSHCNWDFIQGVGGITVGNPKPVPNDGWVIPVECDVSGLTMITTKPRGVNSALVVKDVKCKTKRNRILIWVVSCVATDRYKNSHWIKDIPLKGVGRGKFIIQYLNPDGSTVDIHSIEL